MALGGEGGRGCDVYLVHYNISVLSFLVTLKELCHGISVFLVTEAG